MMDGFSGRMSVVSGVMRRKGRKGGFNGRMSMG